MPSLVKLSQFRVLVLLKSQRLKRDGGQETSTSYKDQGGQLVLFALQARIQTVSGACLPCHREIQQLTQDLREQLQNESSLMQNS